MSTPPPESTIDDPKPYDTSTDPQAAPTTESTTESENPAIKSPTVQVTNRPRSNRDWWPNQVELSVLNKPSRDSDPLGADFDYKAALGDPRRRRAQGGPARGHAHLAGLVAGGLGPLRPAVHPDELARGRHLPHGRRPRRRRRGRSALRPAQQLARQRQPRQGPSPAAAGQAEVRPLDLLGRPARARRQRRPRRHGPEDVRLRLRPRGLLAARGGLLGPRGHLARRRALRRRLAPGPGGGRPRRGDHGPHLRQPRGPAGQAGPAGLRARHQDHLRPDGHERRGDRRAGRGRAHLRQDPRRRQPRARRPGARGLPRPRRRPRLDQPARHRQGRRHHHQRSRGRLDPDADAVGQHLLRDAVLLRVGAHREPRRRQAVEAEEPRGAGARPRRPHRGQAQRPDDGDHGHRAHGRPGAARDLRALLQGPGVLRGPVRPRLVQAAPPRHGPQGALPRPGRPRRGPALAGPGPRGRPRADRGRRRGRARPADPRLRPHGLPARPHRVVGGRLVPRHRQARRRERRPPAPGAAAVVGGQRRHGRGRREAGRGAPGVRQARLAGRHHRARRLRRDREGRGRRGRDRSASRSPRAAPTPPRSRRTPTA